MPSSLNPGDEIVPGYVLVRRLGAGGSGEVWVARAAGGVQVAIKILRDLALLASDRELEALRIVREAKHPNLCPLFGVWFFDQQHNLLSSEEAESILGTGNDLSETVCFDDVKERESSADFDAPGTETVAFSGHTTKPTQMIVAMGLGEQTLMDRLLQVQAERDHKVDGSNDNPETSSDTGEPNGIDPHELIRYMASAASAIDELNERHNIYHCDIKPQNILLVGGQAQVCDFGLARKVEDSRKTSVAFGTPAYGAPEMLFERTYSKTIDQYSLAVTYYELRTGKLPYSSITQSALLRAKAVGEVDLSRVPPAERQVLARATDLDPKLRYGNCQALVAALTVAINNPDVVIVNPSSRSIGYAIPLGVMSSLALLSAILWWAWRGPATADTGQNSSAKAMAIGSISTPELAEPPNRPVGPHPESIDPVKAELPDPATKVNQRLLAIVNNDDPVAQQLAETFAATESSEFQPTWLTTETIESLLQTIDQGIIAASTANDQSTLQTIMSLCSTLIPIAGDRTSNEGPQVARLALSNLSAAMLLAKSDGTEVTEDIVDRVRRLFDQQDRYAYSPASANAALAVAGTWIAKWKAPNWDHSLADHDVTRALKLSRNADQGSSQLRELKSSYLLALLAARTTTDKPQTFNAATIRIAKELEADDTWGSVAGASIGLADPSFKTHTPKPVSVDDSLLNQLPEELHASFLIGAGWNLWNHKQIKQAVNRWEQASLLPGISSDAAQSDRTAAAQHLLDWLMNLSAVPDHTTSRLRYAGKAGSVAPALAIVEQLAIGNATFVSQVNHQQFICNVAAGDFDGAAIRWATLEKEVGSNSNLNPQLGRALFDLALHQLESPQVESKSTWQNRLLIASNAQADAGLLGQPAATTKDSLEARNDLFQRCFKPTTEQVRASVGKPEQLADSGLNADALATFCDSLVSLLTQTDRRSDYGSVVAYVNDIEWAAVIAGRRSNVRDRRAELFFHAADALLRDIHEQENDRSYSASIAKLTEYSVEAKKLGTTVHTDCLDAMVAQEEAYRAIDPQKSIELNDVAIAKYSNVIHSPSAAAKTLFGLAHAGRGRVLERKAIMMEGNEKESLLDEALQDARLAVELTPEDHQDRESRLENLARVCCEVTQITKTKDVAEKLRLIVEAIHAINEAIVIRNNLALDDSQLAMAKLFVLGMNAVVSKGSSSNSAAIREALAWVKKTETLGKQSPSARIKCAWYYNAAIILNEAGEAETALQHTSTARQIAKQEIEPGERISHLVSLAYVVLKSNQLSDRKSFTENQAIISELKQELKSIPLPTPPIASERDDYLLRLEKLESELR